MISQFLGFMLDAYDMALVLIMAPILVKVFISPKGSAAWQYIVIVFTYSITWRPGPSVRQSSGATPTKLAAVPPRLHHRRRGRDVHPRRLLTHLRQGRRLVLRLFCSLRLMMGIFFGGEYAVGTPSPSNMLRKNGAARLAFHSIGFPSATCWARWCSLLVSYLTTKETMLAYGWRIVFMTGVIPVFVALYIRNNLHESPEFEKTKALGKIEKSPFLSLFKPPQVWDFFQVFFFMTGLFPPTTRSMDSFQHPDPERRGFDTTTYSLIYGFALFMAFLGYNFYGWLSDRTGRKILTQWYCAFLVVFGIPVFYVLYHAAIARNLGWPSLHCHGSHAQVGLGSRSRLSLRAFPTRRRAAGVGLATPREPCWAHGSAPTYGGLTRSRLSLRSRGRTYGCRPPSF